MPVFLYELLPPFFKVLKWGVAFDLLLSYLLIANNYALLHFKDLLDTDPALFFEFACHFQDLVFMAPHRAHS